MIFDTIYGKKRGKSAAFVNGEKCHLERIGGGSRGLA